MTGPELDLKALDDCLQVFVPDVIRGPLSADLIGRGRYNLLFGISDANGYGDWVLKRPIEDRPDAPDLDRDAWLLKALSDSYVPVPRPVLFCANPSFLGAPFLVATRPHGATLRTQERLRNLAPEVAQSVGREIVDVLCVLHRTDPEVVGLNYLGTPEDFLHRQVKRWSELLERRRPDLSQVRRLATALEASAPPGDHALVHGDYRLNNLVVDQLRRRVSAVLNWSAATAGDPLCDLSWLTFSLRGFDGLLGSAPTPSPGSGFPDEAYIVDRYEAATSRDLSNLPWYDALSHLKLAAVCADAAVNSASRNSRNSRADAVPGEAIDRAVRLLRDWPARPRSSGGPKSAWAATTRE